MKKNNIIVYALIFIILVIIVCLIVFFVKNLNKPAPATVSNCIKVGNEFLNPGGQIIGECCEGLSEISEIKGKEGYSTCEEAKENLVGWGSICSACGNGICEEWEGICNCLEDCEETLNCHKEGEIFSRAPLPSGGQDLRPCCSGLIDITGTDISVCINCGDKICKDYGSGFDEKDFCPKDCK